jgi:hypothetical protein
MSMSFLKRISSMLLQYLTFVGGMFGLLVLTLIRSTSLELVIGWGHEEGGQKVILSHART